MNTERRAGDGPSIRISLKPDKLTPEAILAAKETAEDWKERGVITNIDWESPSMTATNELGLFSFRIFELSEEDYQENCEKKLGICFSQFCTYLLAALVVFLGDWALPSLQGLVRDVKEFVLIGMDGYEKWVKDNGLRQPHLFHDFLLLLPLNGEQETLTEWMADTIDYHDFPFDGTPRDLPDIMSVFTFGTCLERHMDMASDVQKCRYYPIKLWWMLSMIVPLRPIEFLLTPYDCIRYAASGTCFLTLRRNMIKGSHKKKAYKINEDFAKEEYQVPQFVADEIEEYKRFAKIHGAASCPLGTLLLPQLHYIGMGRPIPKEARYYSYANFNHALRQFHDEVLAGFYKYEILWDRSFASIEFHEGAIYRMLPGDTRHLSLINAAREGVQPQTLAELVRHSGINKTYWYAANDAVLKNCAITQAYMDDQRRYAPIPSIPLAGYSPVTKEGPYLELHDGRCYSPELNNADAPSAIHCIQSTGPHGELGWCPSCPFFRSSNCSDQFDPSRLALDAQTDYEFLLKTIDCFRKEVLFEDSLISAFEKARSSSNILLELVRRMTEGREIEEIKNAKE